MSGSRDKNGRFIKGHKYNTGTHQNKLLANKLTKTCKICGKEFSLYYIDYSKFRRRQICTDKNCKSLAIKTAMSRENNHRWKGGVTPKNKLLRFCKDYKEWREQVFKRDEYRCQQCNKRGGELNADHIKPFSLFPELRFTLSNGRTLCVECHKKTETYGGKINQYARTYLRTIQPTT